MWKLIASLFVMFALNANAQLWEWADQRSEEVRLNRVLPVEGGRWAVIGTTTFAGYHMISVRNGDGTVAWEQVGPYGNHGGWGQVVLMPDSGLLEAGILDGCDFFGPDIRVRRYTPAGTVLWERIMTPFNWQAVMAAAGPGSQVAVASGDWVYILNMDGNTVGGFEVPGADLRKLIWASDSTLFMVRGTQLMLEDLHGTVLESAPIGPDVLDMHWNGQQLLVLTDDSIHRFTPELVPLGASVVPGLEWYSGFAVSESGLYVSAGTGLYEVAEEGTSTQLFPWPSLPNLTTTACAVRNGTVLAVGNTSISGRSTGIVRTLSMAGQAAQHEQNVEILVQVDSAWTEYVGGGYYPWNLRANVTGYVVNHAPDTLRSVVQSMWVSTPYLFCEQATNRIDTAGIALAPGDTISLPFGVVDVAIGYTWNQVLNANAEVCIVALAPDRLADRDPDDNTACVTMDFPLGLSEPARPTELFLAPNPADGLVTVTGTAMLGTPLHLRVLDGTGRLVMEKGVLVLGELAELDVSGLPPGTYILDAMGSRARSTAKLMVVRP